MPFSSSAHGVTWVQGGHRPEAKRSSFTPIISTTMTRRVTCFDMHESITRTCSTRAAGAPITPRDLWPTRCPKCIALLLPSPTSPAFRPRATRTRSRRAAGAVHPNPRSSSAHARPRSPRGASAACLNAAKRGGALLANGDLVSAPPSRAPMLGASTASWPSTW